MRLFLSRTLTPLDDGADKKHLNGWNMKSVVDVCSRRHCGIKMNGWNKTSVVDSMVDGTVVLK